MMNIKFRAWDYYSGMNYNPSVSDGTDGGETSRVCLNSALDDFDGVLMQYTGLKDKNGKEIYKGDVVKYESIYGCLGVSVVDFDEGMFCVSHLSLAQLDVIEIIGNIYENKELLND